MACCHCMSKNTDEKDSIRKLETLGLTEKESRVYLALLPYRDIGSSKLIRATGLHGQFVYDSLSKLEELGLVRHVIQNGRKKFSANTPNRLLSLIEEKRLSAQSIAKELQSRFAGAREQDFEVFQGDSAFAAHQLDLMKRSPEGSAIDVIASETERFFVTMDAEGVWEESEQIRMQKKIRIRYLGSEAQRTRLQGREKKELMWEYRIFPGQSTGLVNTDIMYDNITMNIFSNPILSFTITSKEVADGYREFFNALWNLSSK